MRAAARHRGQRGMTLTEVIVVAFILVILVGLVFESFRFHGQTFRRQLDRGATQANLRIWAARMMLDIRNAGYDPRGSIFTNASLAVQVATPTDFEWKTDANANGSIDLTDPLEYRGYRLDPDAGALQLRQGSSPSWRTVVTGVTSLSFTYWDVQGHQVNQTPPYTSYEDIAEVEFTITAQAGDDAATTATESGAARIRNPG